MNKGVKIVIGIATIGFVGVGLYLLYDKVIKPLREPKTPPNLDEVNTDVISAPTTNAPTTPFKNSAEGNAFRGWINDNYPQYASRIDLDRKGSFSNKYILKAWKEYGNAYQTAGTIAKAEDKAKANAIKVGNYVIPILSVAKRTAYSGNPINNIVANSKYAIPKGIKYRVVKMGKDAQNGKSMSYIFSSADKGSGLFTSFPKGRGFQIYTSYLKKTTF